jgi:hypothetical protein
MARSIEKLFRAPYGVPNGLELTDEGLWIADQITDRVALVEMAEPSEYGVTRLVRDVPSQSSNTSGLAFGDGALWLAANCAATLWRPEKDTDAPKGQGDILKIDPYSGETLERWSVPGGGGTHGFEFDHFEAGYVWVTTLKNQTLSKVRIADWEVVHVIDLPYVRGHGVVRQADGIWVVHTADRVIVKLDLESGAELDRVTVPESDPQPHGLSACGDDLLYCDAASGWIVRINL